MALASGTSSFSYNKLNQLTSGPGVPLSYDTAGRLMEYGTATSTRFYYAGSAMLAEVSNPAGTILRRYVPGPGVALRQVQGNRVQLHGMRAAAPPTGAGSMRTNVVV